MNLILASGSKNRKDLFDIIGFKYEVIKSLVDEECNLKDPKEYVIKLSLDKANSVATQVNNDAIIVAADSIMYMNDKIFEKPKTKKEAYDNLKLMSGRIVYAITGITVKDLYQDKIISLSDVCEIHFRDISESEINWYIENEKGIFDYCGFALEGKASIFIDRIIGDYNTARGISINKLNNVFEQLGYSISDFELE